MGSLQKMKKEFYRKRIAADQEGRRKARRPPLGDED
jgi:hypothetical protein